MSVTMRRILGAPLLVLAFAPGVAVADQWKDESGKQWEQAKEFSKQQEKLWEQERKFLEKRREHFEKLREKEREQWEKARKEQAKQWKRYRKDVEKRREAFGERWDRRAPFDVPPQRSYRAPYHRPYGYAAAPYPYDSPGYELPPRFPLPPYARRPSDGELPAPRHDPRRRDDAMSERPFGYGEQRWQRAPGGDGPRPIYRGNIDPRERESWND